MKWSRLDMRVFVQGERKVESMFIHGDSMHLVYRDSKPN